MQLELHVAHLATAGHRQVLDRAERERALALDVETFVKRAQLALRGSRVGSEAFDGALGYRERQPREGQTAEQVVPVSVGGQQSARSGKPCLLYERGQRIQLIGQHRGVDHERLCTPADRGPAHDHAVDLQQHAGDHEHVRMQRDGSHARATDRQVMPSSFAASLRLWTSAVGFFWEGSRVSLLRLTQMTGTRCFRHGTTSW